MKNKKINTKKIVKISFNVIFYFALFFMILFSFANMKLKTNGDIANLFGRGFVSVLTGSMDGEKSDSFSVNDIVFVKLLDSNEEKATLNKGDIITFYKTSIAGLNQPGLITHRINEIVLVDGKVYYETKGDANDDPDDDLLNHELVLSVYTGQLAGAGKVIKTLQTPNGFALYIILPIALFMIFEGVMLTRNIMAISKSKMEEKFAQEKENALSDLELEKEKMRKQILEELKKEQSSQE